MVCHCILETRIKWAEKFITSYYSAEGTLHRLRSKDQRTAEFHTCGAGTDSAPDTKEGWRCCGCVYQSRLELDEHKTKIKEALHYRENMTTM